MPQLDEEPQRGRKGAPHEAEEEVPGAGSFIQSARAEAVTRRTLNATALRQPEGLPKQAGPHVSDLGEPNLRESPAQTSGSRRRGRCAHRGESANSSLPPSVPPAFV
jgi:hypothetical protein